MKTELFKKVYIHSVDDLPKETGRYWCHEKYVKSQDLIDSYHYDKDDKDFCCDWLNTFDWYLLPVSLPVTLPTDEEIDIEGEFKQAMKRKNQDYAEGYVEGLQDGWLIKSRLTDK